MGEYHKKPVDRAWLNRLVLQHRLRETVRRRKEAGKASAEERT